MTEESLRPVPGNALLMAGYAGLHGTRIILERKREELLGRFTPEFLASAEEAAEWEMPDAAAFLETLPGVTNVTPLREGGFYQGLWAFMKTGRCGIRADLQAVPIRQETVEVCEFFGGNPYRLDSEGCVIAAAADSGPVVEACREAGIVISVIGEVRPAPEKTVYRDGEPFFLERVKRPFLEELGFR